MADADERNLAERSDPLPFVKELATYYMDFLETDFHRRKNPKRSIRFRSADNLLVGVNLARYPAFVQATWKVILSGFSRDTLAEIRKGAYRTAFPATLLQLIKLEVDKVTEKQMGELRAAIGGDIVQLSRANRTDYDKAITVTIEAAGGRIRAGLLSPFMSHIRTPLAERSERFKWRAFLRRSRFPEETGGLRDPVVQVREFAWAPLAAAADEASLHTEWLAGGPWQVPDRS